MIIQSRVRAVILKYNSYDRPVVVNFFDDDDDAGSRLLSWVYRGGKCGVHILFYLAA